jgi:hypothetical protein
VGEAKRRGTFEERKSMAIVRKQAEQTIQDREYDMRDLERGRYYPSGKINPTIMALYLSALAKKGVIR